MTQSDTMTYKSLLHRRGKVAKIICRLDKEKETPAIRGQLLDFWAELNRLDESIRIRRKLYIRKNRHYVQHGI